MTPTPMPPRTATESATSSRKVTIIILNWNGLADTVQCLDSLKQTTYPDYRVLIVDNASEGDEVTQLRLRFGDYVDLMQNDRNLGFAGGCNIGIRRALAAGTDYVLLLNNDTTVGPEFLTELVTVFEQVADAAAVCPKVYHFERPDVIQSTGGRVNPWTGTARQVGRDEPDRSQYDRIEERDYADGACLLISKQAIEKVGLLSEDYFSYWEETDWCDRARDFGFKCYYVPSARIWHRGARASTPQRYQYLYRRNAFLFLRRRKTPFHVATALLYHVFVLAPSYLLRHPTALPRLLTEARALLWHAGRRLERGARKPLKRKAEP